jgi:2,4-dienoyl-CoA reductase-like NADH-dependent reductase (Old Yellow Enzyme family)
MTKSIDSPFTQGKIANLTLRNRIIRSGCFEGMCQEGKITDALIEHHRRVAEGGVGMTTVAYCSVSYDGRAFGHEMWMRQELIPDLKRLTDAVHQEGAAASIQIGHCGFFSNPKEIGRRPLGASVKFCLFRLSICEAMNEAQIAEKIEDFGRTAEQVKEAGFDAVEIHAGHGYLLSQFLSPWTNHRNDQYGGSLENRMRFPLAVIRRVREGVGEGFPILIKTNASDGIRGGLEIEEAVEVAKAFEAAGASALVISCGFTAKTPIYMMRGNVPVKEMAANQTEWLLRLGMSLFGWFMVQRYRFDRLFLLNEALRFKEAVKIPVIYIGGVLRLEDIGYVLARGFEFVEVGRATVRDADFVKKMESGEVTVSDCDQCNRCIATMDAGGIYCVTASEGK